MKVEKKYTIDNSEYNLIHEGGVVKVFQETEGSGTIYVTDKNGKVIFNAIGMCSQNFGYIETNFDFD